MLDRKGKGWQGQKGNARAAGGLPDREDTVRQRQWENAGAAGELADRKKAQADRDSREMQEQQMA